jgi:hypothetical protein
MTSVVWPGLVWRGRSIWEGVGGGFFLWKERMEDCSCSLVGSGWRSGGRRFRVVAGS